MKKILFICLLVLLTPGCIIQSIHPFYTEGTKVELNEINGEWISIIQLGDKIENKGICPWSFKNKTIITYDDKNIKSKLECTYFKVGDKLFVDTTAGEPEVEINLCWAAGITLVHTLCKVNLDNNTLELIPINAEWFDNRIEEKMLDMSYVKVGMDNYLFTITSKEWVKFLEKHADNPELFNKNYSYIFKRKLGH